MLGDHHPFTVAALASAADAQHAAGRTADAIDNLREALAGYLDALGPDHPNTRGAQALLTSWEEESDSR